ncbi:MAG: type II secretion system F family protein [Phycicoccus sp.]
MVVLIAALTSLSLLVALVAVIDLVSPVILRRRALLAAAEVDERTVGEWWTTAELAFARTRLGTRVSAELVLSGSGYSPLVVICAMLLLAVVLGLLLAQLAPVLGVAGLVVAGLALRAWLARGRSRRLEAFVEQMPDLARVLANATHAGLSMSTSIAVAATEMGEPARQELSRVASALAFGMDVETALDQMRERLPAREVAVLMSTLLVSARAGGSLVTSLRSIAQKLEDRKEVRREVRTTLAQSVTTSYFVIALGLGLVVLLEVLRPGTVDRMTQSTFGQLAFGFAVLTFGGGYLAIRRMTRIVD